MMDLPRTPGFALLKFSTLGSSRVYTWVTQYSPPKDPRARLYFITSKKYPKLPVTFHFPSPRTSQAAPRRGATFSLQPKLTGSATLTPFDSALYGGRYSFSKRTPRFSVTRRP